MNAGFAGHGAWVVVDTSGTGRDATSIDELLEELDQLRELDQRRHAHAPGSPDHDSLTLELEACTRRLMDRFRDLQLLRPGRSPRPTGDSLPATILEVARPVERPTIWGGRTG